MGFDDLDKAVGEQNQNDEQDDGKDIQEVLDEADEDAADVVEELESGASSSGSSATSPEVSKPAGESGASSREEALSEPAFEYEDVRQSPLYAREETWDEFEDAVDLDVVRALREAGVRGESKREIHDAALQVAAERPQEVA